MSHKPKTQVAVIKAGYLKLSENADVKALLKENEGRYVGFEGKEATKTKLYRVSVNHKKWLEKMAEVEDMTPAQIKRTERIIQYNRKTRYALQNIRDHNADVITKAAKEEKTEKNGLIEYVRPIEELGAEVLEANKTRAETKEQERKDAIQSMIDNAKIKLELVIIETEDFAEIDAKIEEFTTIADEAAKSEFQEMKGDFNTMVAEVTQTFDDKIKQITIAHNLGESNKQRDIAELKADRLQELFDWECRYKGKVPLGELSGDEYDLVLDRAKLDYMEKELKAIGFNYQDHPFELELIQDEKTISKISLDEIKAMNWEEAQMYIIKHADPEAFKKTVEEVKSLEEDQQTFDATVETAGNVIAAFSQEPADANEIEVQESEAAPEVETESAELSAGGTQSKIDEVKSYSYQPEKFVNEANAGLFVDRKAEARNIMRMYSDFRVEQGENPLSTEHIEEFIKTLK